MGLKAMRGLFSRLLPSDAPNGEQKPAEAEASGRSSARGEIGGAAIADPGALHASVGKLVFVLDGDGRIAALSNPLLNLLAARDRTLIGCLARDVFAGAAELVSSGLSGPVRFQSSDGTRWQAFLTIEPMPLTAKCVVPMGTLTQICAVSATEPELQSPRSSSPAAEAASFGNAIRQQIKAKGAALRLTAGRIELVGLDEVKKALGAKWPAQAARAKVSAMAVIAKRLTDADMFAEVDNDTFIICFASLSAEEAMVKSELIAREIRERLIGEDCAGFKIVPQAAEIRFEKEEAEESIDLTALLKMRLDAALVQHRQSAASRVKVILQTSRLALAPVLNVPLLPTGLTMARISSDCGSFLDRIGKTEDGLKMIFELDCLLLGLVIEHIYQDIRQEKAQHIIVPVNYSTLSERKISQEYVSLLQRIDEIARGYILFMLVGVTQDIAQSRLQEILSRLSPFSIQRILRAPNVNYNLPDLDCLRVAMVSVASSKSHITTSNGSNMFKSFASRIHNSGLRSPIHASKCRLLVSDIRDSDTARWYSSNGADFMCVSKCDGGPD